MPRQRQGPLVRKDLEWLHRNDTLTLPPAPTPKSAAPTNKPNVIEAEPDEFGNVDDNFPMKDVTSKRPRDPTPEAGVGKVPRMDGMDNIAGTSPNTNLRLGAGMAGSANGSNGTGETPVDMNVTPELGFFTETRTAILPVRFGIGLHGLRPSDSTNIVRIRMNAPYNILDNTTFVSQSEGAAVTVGPSTCQAPAGSTNPSSLLSFETTLITSTAPTASTSGSGVVADNGCRPAYRTWYERIYESYHTMKCDYRITITSPETSLGRRAAVYVDQDVYTTSSSGNIMPATGSQLLLNSVWKKLDKHIVGERTATDRDGWIKVIEGTWRPGQWAKNTLNAEDIKAWYSTGAAPSPAWYENLVLLFKPDEYSTESPNVNIFVELRYTVQFKDLKQAFRYPQPTGTAITFSTPSAPASTSITDQAVAAGDVLQTPLTQYPWGSDA